jgi:hypothetical protein
MMKQIISINLRHLFILSFLLFFALEGNAQIGNYRNDFAIGFNGGYALSSFRFTPKVNQSMHGGMVGGITLRYTCEKYFSTICALQAEVNYAQMGWKESILDYQDKPVINDKTNQPEEYSRTINYLQIPLLAHLGWGRESKGFQFFFQAGPQLGYCLSESTKMNFKLEERNTKYRVNNVVAQDTMAVENKFDYGITAGLGVEFSTPHMGHFILEGRYYYGLGNIYGDTKKDYFASSNMSSIMVKLTWLFDIVKTKL